MNSFLNFYIAEMRLYILLIFVQFSFNRQWFVRLKWYLFLLCCVVLRWIWILVSFQLRRVQFTIFGHAIYEINIGNRYVWSWIDCYRSHAVTLSDIMMDEVSEIKAFYFSNLFTGEQRDWKTMFKDLDEDHKLAHEIFSDALSLSSSSWLSELSTKMAPFASRLISCLSHWSGDCQ